jgi:hypothetical protein
VAFIYYIWSSQHTKNVVGDGRDGGLFSLEKNTLF